MLGAKGSEEESEMTENQIKQIRNQLPEGERIDRMYSAYEGGIRVITKNAAKQ